jgi:GNAT superfamily N-acetyltransferase
MHGAPSVSTTSSGAPRKRGSIATIIRTDLDMARARRTYLEMREAVALVPARHHDFHVEIAKEEPCAPDVYRAVYLGVGRAYHWVDRAEWSDREIVDHLARPDIGVWIVRSEGELAGFFELRRCDDGSVEIAYFGLLPAFIGRGLGGYLLTVAVRESWALGACRVWLHTSTLDHASALSNYLKRGFEVTRIEEYEVM